MLTGAVEVQRFSADGLTGSRPIVYSDALGAQHVQAYHYHFWTESPTLMLRNELIKILRSAGVAQSVVTSELRVEASYGVSGRIRRFEQVRGTAKQVLAEIEINLTQLVSERLLLIKSYRVVKTAKDDSVDAAVAALGESIQEIFDRFIEDIKANPPQI